MYRRSLFIAWLGFCTVPLAVAELPPSSVPARTRCEFQDHTDVTVEYGGMQVAGRKIFGGVVPYGRIWETGYKRSPALVTGANLVVGG